MNANIIHILFVMLVWCPALLADDTGSLLEQSLNGYIASFRIESRLLTDKIQSPDTKRAYLKMVETAVTEMESCRKDFESAAKRYFDHAEDKNLVTALRLALDAKQKEEAYLHSVLFSNTVMFGICSLTHSYADESVDKEGQQIIKALVTLHSYFRDQAETLMKRIEQELSKPKSAI